MNSIRSDGGRPWALFLSRAAALKALVTVALVATFGVVMSAAPSAPFEQAELIGASRNLAAYRIFAALDTLLWLGFGAVLLGFAGLAAGRSPVRSVCIAALAVTQVVGMVGGYLRLVATTAVATRFTAAGVDAQAAMLESYQEQFAIIAAHFGLGQVLYGIAFLLIASTASKVPGFARPLAYLIGLLGAYSLANQLSVVLLGEPLWAPLFFLFLALTVVMDVAVAGAFWRERSTHGAAASAEPSP